MKAARIALLALVCTVPLAASAQWQWVDKGGRKVFSDQAPPPDIAPDKILRRPGSRAAAAPEAPAAEAAAPASASRLAVAKPAGKDPALEQKRKEAEAAEAAKKKADEEKIAAVKADNCTRAKSAKMGFDSGQRIARTNDKGEKEYLDDNQRAAEAKRLEVIIARDCPARDRQ